MTVILDSMTYVNLYIYVREIKNLMVSKYVNIKKLDIQRTLLLILELFAKVKSFDFEIKPLSGQLICDFLSSELYLVLFLKGSVKRKKILTFHFRSFETERY